MTKTTKRYVKLKRGNDWGVEYFTTPDKTKLNNLKDALTFQNGSKIKIKWPSGKLSTETIANKQYHDIVGDMGNIYPVDYKLAGFNKKIYGVDVWFSLDKVEVILDV